MGDFFEIFASFMLLTSWPPDTFIYARDLSAVVQFNVICPRLGGGKAKKQRPLLKDACDEKMCVYKRRINKGKCEHLKHIIPALLIYCRSPLFIEYFMGIWLYGSWWGNERILFLTAKIFAVNVMTCLVYNMILSRWLFFKFQKWKNMP